MDPLITPDRLAERLGDPRLRIVDATLLASELGRNAAAEFEGGHIPGAVFLDLASLRDAADPLPNALPSPGAVATRVAALGLGEPGTDIVLYDDSPWRSAARAWWLLRVHGVPASLLDGGMAAWRTGGFPVESGPARPSPVAERPLALDPAGLRRLDDLRDGSHAMVDARSPARFTGAEADPHGAAPGHIPGSRNLHYAALFDAAGRWKRGDTLAAAFRDAEVDPARPFVATCGSGITATCLVFGAHLLGHDAALYDGSWAEWGADFTTPKATGAA